MRSRSRGGKRLAVLVRPMTSAAGRHSTHRLALSPRSVKSRGIHGRHAKESRVRKLARRGKQKPPAREHDDEGKNNKVVGAVCRQRPCQPRKLKSADAFR